jgi:hypothetical protein
MCLLIPCTEWDVDSTSQRAAVLNLAPEFEDWRISILTIEVNF